jgi:hemolysin activation/secretion protein
VPIEALSRRLMALSPLLLVSAEAAAQSDPASLERTIPDIEVQKPDQRQDVAAPEVPEAAGAKVAASFVLGAVNIEGATVFTAAELAQSFEPFLASTVGQAELDRITADITERYRRAGYVLSYAVLPEQSVESGIVRIRVVEGYIDKIRLEGAGRSAGAVRDIARRLGTERPLRKSTLERGLGLMRDLPGVIVTDARLSRSPRDPARHQLTIVLGTQRSKIVTYSDNRGTIDGARMRGFSSVRLSSLAVPGDELELDLFAIPSDKFRFLYGQATASLPLGSDGLRLSAAVSRGDQLLRLPGPDQQGESRQLFVDLAFPFAKSRRLSLVGHASLTDWLSTQERGGTLVQRDRLQAVRAWMEFEWGRKARFDGRLGVSLGLDVDDATDAGDPLASRSGAGGTFAKFDADLTFAAPLARRLMLRIETSAQYSTRPLLAPEEFALGGSRIGRAFDFNEVTGDHGVGAMLELTYRVADGGKRSGPVQLFGYVDGGGVFLERSGAHPDEQWLASAGAGARLSVFGILYSGEVGVPIARSHIDRDPRLFFSATKAF